MGDTNWFAAAVTAVLGFLGGLVAYRKNHAQTQEQNIKALELRVKILEKDNENHIREKTALAIEAQLHEEDYRQMVRDNRHLERLVDANTRRILQFERWAKTIGHEPPEPNGDEEEVHPPRREHRP